MNYKHNIIQTNNDREKRDLIGKLFNNMNNFNPTDLKILKELQQKGYNENIPLLGEYYNDGWKDCENDPIHPNAKTHTKK